MTVCLGRKLDDPPSHYVTLVSPHRYNHHIEVKSQAIADSAELKSLVLAGYEFASKC